ncbi:MAG TPA: hypothetical protein VMV46_05545, partial [Thermoanaerobaculia bacterium]|nr:hypothetical protein [Thermoanaerobaculia bacterium]
GLLALPGLHRLRHWLTQQPKRMLWLMLPMLIDVALPWSTWWSRFATGLLAAVPVALVLWLACDQILAPRRRGAAVDSRPTTGRLEVAEWKGSS